MGVRTFVQNVASHDDEQEPLGMPVFNFSRRKGQSVALADSDCSVDEKPLGLPVYNFSMSKKGKDSVSPSDADLDSDADADSDSQEMECKRCGLMFYPQPRNPHEQEPLAGVSEAAESICPHCGAAY